MASSLASLPPPNWLQAAPGVLTNPNSRQSLPRLRGRFLPQGQALIPLFGPLPASQRPQAALILAPTRLLRPQTGLILELLPVGNQAYCFTFPQITRALLHATMLVQAGHLSPGDDSSFSVSVPTSAPCTVLFIALGKISLNLSQTLSPAPGLSRLPVPYPSGLQTPSPSTLCACCLPSSFLPQGLCTGLSSLRLGYLEFPRSS